MYVGATYDTWVLIETKPSNYETGSDDKNRMQ